MKDIYLSLGSNIGDRALSISRAIDSLPVHGVHVVQQSSPYETEPVELRDQEWFLNGVVEVETKLTPQRLMQALLDIERSMGRLRLTPKGPRIIDMDILLFGSTIVHEPGLADPASPHGRPSFCARPIRRDRRRRSPSGAQENNRRASRRNARQQRGAPVSVARLHFKSTRPQAGICFSPSV